MTIMINTIIRINITISSVSAVATAAAG